MGCGLVPYMSEKIVKEAAPFMRMNKLDEQEAREIIKKELL